VVDAAAAAAGICGFVTDAVMHVRRAFTCC